MSRSHSIREIAAFSRSLLDRPLRSPRELTVAIASDQGNVAGAFGYDEALLPVRGSGGPTLTIGLESVYIALKLEDAAALEPDLDVLRVINRAVRPLLRALKKSGLVSAMYGARDFVAVKGAPIAWVGFQHDAATNRVAFEAFIAARAPLEPAGRATFRGRAPVSLRDLKCEVAAHVIAGRIYDAYASEFSDLTESSLAVAGAEEGEPHALAFARVLAFEEDAIGRVGICELPNGQRAIRGDFQASRDFVLRANASLARAQNAEDACAAIDEAANAEHVVVFGLASLDAMKRAVRRAFHA